MERLELNTVAKVKPGELIYHFPIYEGPEKNFDTSQTKLMQAYEVTTISATGDIVGIVVAAGTFPFYPLSGQISRLFINRCNLVA